MLIKNSWNRYSLILNYLSNPVIRLILSSILLAVHTMTICSLKNNVETCLRENNQNQILQIPFKWINFIMISLGINGVHKHLFCYYAFSIQKPMYFQCKNLFFATLNGAVTMVDFCLIKIIFTNREVWAIKQWRED